MMMVGVGIYTSELEAIDWHDLPVPYMQPVMFARRTMPAFSVGIYSKEPIPHRRHMH